MRADKLVSKYGERLIGRKIFTQPVGIYPAMLVTITELEPDPNAPEIVMQIEDPVYGSVGVFEFEEVVLLSP